MTIAELSETVRQSPQAGTIFARKDFRQLNELGVYKDAKFVVSTNYQCLDPYSDTQRVVHLGFCGTVYRGRMQTFDFQLTSQDDLAEALENAYQRAGAVCDHDFARQLSQQECREQGILHHGNCWHVYQCSKCGTHHAHDSSD